MGGRQARKGMSRIPCPDMYPKTASLAQFRNTTEFLITDFKMYRRPFNLHSKNPKKISDSENFEIFLWWQSEKKVVFHTINQKKTKKNPQGCPNH